MKNLLNQSKLNLKFEFEESAERALNGYVNNDKALDRIRALLIDFNDAPETFKNKPVMKMIPKEQMMVEFTMIALTYRETEKRVIVHNVIYKDRRVTQSEWDEICKIAANES